MVHFRYCLDLLLKQNAIGQKVHTLILTALKKTSFGQRTIDKFLTLLAEQGYAQTARIKNEFERYRIKQHDLLDFLMAFPNFHKPVA
jgi:Fe2+ or Zn2+ uptake regulation protein